MQRNIIETLWQDDKAQNKDLMKGLRKLWTNNTVPYTIVKGLRKCTIRLMITHTFTM